MQTYIIITVIAVFFSAFFSGIEIAYITASKLKIEIERKKSRYSSFIMGLFLKNPSQFIATMLIGNNLALVVYGIFIALILEPFIRIVVINDWLVLLIQTLISTMVILITGEFTPKILFRINPNKVLRVFAFPVMLFYIILFPIARFTTILSNLFLRLIAGKKSIKRGKVSVFDRYDLGDLIYNHKPDTQNQALAESNVKMFRNVLDFRDITVRECVVPRNELVAVDSTEEVCDVVLLFTKTGYSRILVYDDNIDNIIGYVHTSDMLIMPSTIKSIIHAIPIVPETMPANKLLGKLIKQRKSIALVVDEFGGTSGVVTMEDIIEEIIGEIEDEHDTNLYEEKKLEDNKYLFSGRLEIDHLNEKYGFGIEENESYETLAGFIIHHHRNIPKQNQVITISNFTFKIIKATGTQIKTVEMLCE
ncbi:MAG: hemolysin family protein [Salinivirgaceae bacterium]|nr:hemolysin family protein [Salinivirgaceae bacterium]MDD4745847.1 hemolysin family protein [Salinivirgaceae bacterium]MDY0281265.1 hemolysin family protein [Salinivirgaceae bacterium]